MASRTSQLIMRGGPTPGKVYELTQAIISIGRDYSNDIVINDVEVSRKHVRLTAQGGGYLVEDMGSTNGTFVNGQRLMGPHLLRPGELVTLGERITLFYEAPAFDPNATLMAPTELPTYHPPTPAYIPPAQAPGASSYAQPAPAAYPQAAPPPVVAPAPVYAGQIPDSPAEDAGAGEKPSRTWILLGAGCLLVFLCVCVGSAYVFDSLNLYCLPPFSTLFNWLYTCP
jgi:hypothetical protein